MTVLAEVLSEQFPGNGTADEFDFDFTIFDSSELVARDIVDATGIATLLVLGVDYTISVSTTAGGTVTTTDPVANGHTLDLRPVYEVTQPTDIKNQGTFRPDVHERALDRLASQNQMLMRLVRRCLHLADYGEDNASLVLPSATARAGKYLAFDGAAEPIGASGTGSDSALRTDLASTALASEGSRLAGYKRTETGAIARSVYSVLEASAAQVEDFGASTSASAAVNTAAIQAAFNAVRDSGVALAFKPGGNYAVNASLTLLRIANLSSTPDKYVIFGNGATLDFSASGLTSGKLFRLGATSQSFFAENGYTKFVSPLYILGPETGNPRTDPTPDGTTIGWSLEYCANPDLSGCWARRCYEGIRTDFVFQFYAARFYARQCYIGAYITDGSTLAEWDCCAFTEAIYGVVLQLADNAQTISNQLFIQPWIQDVQVAFSVDPLNGTGVGVDGLTIISPYYETITYDYHRLGLAWTFANPGTPGADRNRDTIAVSVPPGGQWGGPTWSATKRPYRTTTASTLKGGDIWMPAAMSTLAGSFSAITIRAGLDKLIGDSSVIQTSLGGGLAIGSGGVISKTLVASATWDPASLNDGQVASTTVTVTGASVGDQCVVGFTVAIPGGMMLSADITNTDTATVKLHNVNAGTTNLASGTLKLTVFKQ